MSAIMNPMGAVPVPAVDPELLWKAEYKYFSLKRKEMNNDKKFFTKYPEWFFYMVIGRELLLKMSKSRQFQRFTNFQVDFMLSFLNPIVYKMFLVSNRGGAKSWLIAACCVLDICINENMDITLLAGSEEQANKVFAYAKRMLTDELSGAKGMVKRHNAEEIELHNGSHLYRLAASPTSTRGPRGDKLAVDEITQIKPDILTGFFGQAITSATFKLVCGGTPDDPTHTAYSWWCSPPRENVHHWFNADSGFHLFHWNAFDCSLKNGGWIYPETLAAMEGLYSSRLDYRREILGLWTSNKGSIIQLDDIDAATRDFHIRDLPDPKMLDGMIVSVDGARHSHYATIVGVGYMKSQAYVYHAKGFDNITEDKLRRHIMRVAINYNRVTRTYVVIENAPISATLIDNVRNECMEQNMLFFKSFFGQEKNRFVDSVCNFFENKMVKLPSEYTQLINELFMWRWADNGKPEKGNDDFVDALCHNMHNTNKIYYEEHEKTHAGADADQEQGDAPQLYAKSVNYFKARFAHNRTTNNRGF